MAKPNCNAELTISKTHRRSKVGYVSVRHEDRKTHMTRFTAATPACI